MTEPAGVVTLIGLGWLWVGGVAGPVGPPTGWLGGAVGVGAVGVPVLGATGAGAVGVVAGALVAGGCGPAAGAPPVTVSNRGA